MSEITETPVPDLGGYAPEAIQQTVQTSVDLGIRTPEHARAFLEENGLPTGPYAPTTSKADAAPAIDTSGMNLTPAQLKKMTEWAVADKLMTQEDADKALADAGVDAPAAASDVDKHLAEEGMAPGTAAQFELPPLMSPDASDADIGAAHATVTGWMVAAKLSPVIGKNLAHVTSEWIPRWRSMNESERVIQHAETESVLQKTWGDEFPQRVARVRQLCREIDAARPGFLEFVESSGVGNDPTFIQILAGHADLLHGRHIKKESNK